MAIVENNNTTDAHSELARQLDKAPLGAAMGPELMELLKELFSTEQAEIASALSFKPTKVSVLAAETGLDQQELSRKLALMADMGLVYERQTKKEAYYSLVPVMPGLAELQFMKNPPADSKRRLAQLFHAYYKPGMGEAQIRAAMPYSRVIPIGKSLENTQEILPFEKAEDVIAAQSFIALTNCFCREEAELLGHACDAPKDVCMMFGAFGRFVVNKGLARKLDVAEALKVLEKAEDAGLVHVTDNVAEGANFMCNCCGCCCMFLRTITEMDSPGAVAAASYLAEVDGSECTECGACLEACQVKAIKMDSGPAVVDPFRCVGCGQCKGSCAFGAIEMASRRSGQPAANFQELAFKLIQARA